jgi:O-antigen/teichoic acid export membrane protein
MVNGTFGNAASSNSGLNRRIIFGIAAGWGSKAVAIIVNFVQIPLLYRYLDKEVIGVWFLMVGTQMLLGLFDFGFGQTLQRRIAFAKGNCGSCPDTVLDKSTQQHIRDLLTIAKRFYQVVSGIVLVVLLAGGPLYFSTLKLSPVASDGLRMAWIIMSIGYAANIWGWFVESTLDGLGDIGWSNIVQHLAFDTCCNLIVLASADNCRLGVNMGA